LYQHKNKYLGVAIFALNIEYCRIVGYKNVAHNEKKRYNKIKNENFTTFVSINENRL